MRTPTFLHRPRRATALAGVALALAVAPLTACGDDDEPVRVAGAAVDDQVDAPPSVLELTATDHTFEADVEAVAAGPVTVSLANEGAEPHQVHFGRLAAGDTAADFVEAFERDGEAAASAMVDWAGGVNGVEPGATEVATADLAAGEYVMICFIPSPGHHGVSHAMQGMVVPLRVVDAGDAVAPPSADSTVVLRDYAVDIPEGFTGGPVEVRNDGQDHHELIVMKFDEGKAVADLIAWQAEGMPAERPFDYVGGFGTIPPGGRGWADLDLGPGSYLALCVIPGPDGTPHVEMGMATPFTVPG